MPKSTQSNCKRTRGRSKQTSLLDFDNVPNNKSRKRGQSTTAACGLAAAAAASAAASCGEESETLVSSRGSSIGGTSAVSASNYDGGQRRKGRATVFHDVTVVAAASKDELSAHDDDQTHDTKQPPRASVPSDNAATCDVSPRKKRRRRATVFYDVTVAAPRPVRATAASKVLRGDTKRSSITPSPDLTGSDDKNATPSSDSMEVEEGDEKTIIGSPDSSDGEHIAGKESSERSKDTMPMTEKPELICVKSVTIDPLDGASAALLDTNQSHTQTTHHQTQQQQQSLMPAFHQPWHQPYSPTKLPPGVIDIDAIPHRCCMHSLQSHAGYSWITSKRRCPCVKDSNHCSIEAVTDAYLGSYGVERYGDVGLAGVGGGRAGLGSPTVNEGDWKVEEWWLGRTRQEREENADGRSSQLWRKRLQSGKKERPRKSVTRDGARNPMGRKFLKDIEAVELEVEKNRSNDGNDGGNQDGEEEEDESRTPSPTSTLSDVSPPRHKHLLRPIQTSTSEHLDYMSRQPHINVHMREILMEWLVEVAEEYKLCSETFWLSVTLVDRSLACSYGRIDDEKESKQKKKDKKKRKEDEFDIIGGEMIVKRDQLQLVGCACTFIASKLMEIAPPTADEFVYISDNTYTPNEVLDMEARIASALKFNLNFRTPYHYVDRFLRASYASSESSCASAMMCGGMNDAKNATLKNLVIYLLDLAVLEYKLVSKKPSLVTASAVYLARATLGIREARNNATGAGTTTSLSTSPSLDRALSGFWSNTLEYYTGYDVWDVEEAVRLLHRLHENAEVNRLPMIFNKHKKAKYGRVALKIVANEAELGFL